jgi:benzoyl-CoA reductase/2-hydroxyglutaryl-CoA dehydratase subunit BcrC/BadD/HgdB
MIVEKVIQQLRENQSLRKTAIILNIDRNTIYKILRYRGIDPKSITGRKYTKRSKKQNENRNQESRPTPSGDLVSAKSG